MTHPYQPPAIKTTVESVDAQFDNAEWLLKRSLKHLKRCKQVWESQGKPDMEQFGAMTQETCANGAPHFKLLHRCTDAADGAGDVLHGILSAMMDENVSEGNKCFP
eukprot:GHVR01046828.1.p1 GENE.GHVR01046828.1~~GHVR01046828.1.p1  ORF type:complete len:106 (+),score=9.49 GHVR01046828.1:157-474(+)